MSSRRKTATSCGGMAGEFDWAPRRVRLGLRFALGVAIMRLSVGLLVLLVGLGLAVLHFQPPPQPAGIDQLVLSQSAENELTTASTSSAGAGGGVSGTKPSSSDVAPWEHRTIVIAGSSDPDAPRRTVIHADATPERLSGADLTRALQAELQRVGCYHGGIDGDWGPMSRRAMSAFNEHTNASLPVDSPDDSLLRMVRGFNGQACGQSQTTVAGGDDSRRGEPLPGRMAVGGPVEADANVPLTRYVPVEEPRAAPPERQRQVTRRSRVAERSSPSPSYRPPRQERKSWMDRVFNPSGP